MTSTTSTKKPTRPAKSLDDEINATREKLRLLEDQKKEKERKEREKNQRAVLDLLKAEKLDTIPIENWKKIVPQLRDLLTKK